MEANIKQDLEGIDLILAKIADQEMQVEALKPSIPMEVSVPQPAAPVPALAAHPVFETLRIAVQGLPDGLTAATPMAPDNTVIKLTEVLSSIPTTTPPPAGSSSTFGPAAAVGTLTAARVESQPYHVPTYPPPETTATAADAPVVG